MFTFQFTSCLALLAIGFLTTPNPSSALTFGELQHQFTVGPERHFVTGEFTNLSIADSTGQFWVNASVFFETPDHLHVSYTVVRDTWNQADSTSFESTRIPFTLLPGEDLRIVGTSVLDVSPLDYNQGGSARWIVVDPITNIGTRLHSAPNGFDAFDLTIEIAPGNWELIYQGRAAAGTVNSTGQPPATISADFVIFTPEPSTALLLGLGLVGLAVGRRRKLHE